MSYSRNSGEIADLNDSERSFFQKSKNFFKKNLKPRRIINCLLSALLYGLMTYFSYYVYSNFKKGIGGFDSLMNFIPQIFGSKFVSGHRNFLQVSGMNALLFVLISAIFIFQCSKILSQVDLEEGVICRIQHSSLGNPSFLIKCVINFFLLCAIICTGLFLALSSFLMNQDYVQNFLNSKEITISLGVILGLSTLVFALIDSYMIYKTFSEPSYNFVYDGDSCSPGGAQNTYCNHN
jgi:hypothetical protein